MKGKVLYLSSREIVALAFLLVAGPVLTFPICRNQSKREGYHVYPIIDLGSKPQGIPEGNMSCRGLIVVRRRLSLGLKQASR